MDLKPSWVYLEQKTTELKQNYKKFKSRISTCPHAFHNIFSKLCLFENLFRILLISGSAEQSCMAYEVNIRNVLSGTSNMLPSCCFLFNFSSLLSVQNIFRILLTSENNEQSCPFLRLDVLCTTAWNVKQSCSLIYYLHFLMSAYDACLCTSCGDFWVYLGF